MPLALVFFLLLSVAVRAGGLFNAGAWAPIVLPAEPEPDEWYGAQSLADWCERVTGQRPEVILEEANKVSPSCAIFIGQTQAAKAAKISLPAVEGDVALREVRRSAVFLLGNNPVSTRIAIGRFCEQQLGIFFVQPSARGADWKMLSEVRLPERDLFRPAFAWRSIGGLNEMSSDWAYSIGYGQALTFSHGFYAAFGKKEWKQDPTLFAQINGKRIEPLNGGYDPNPNLAHSLAPEIGARYARAWFHKYPEAMVVPLGINDSIKFDDSVPSEGWYRDRAVRTDYVMNYLNKVAGSFWQPAGDLEGKSHALGTLAYLQTLRAPKVKLHPAIFPWVCADRFGYADPAFAAMESANLAAWVKSGAKRVGAYDYWYGVDYCVPRINFAAEALAIRTEKAVGVKGWIAELYPIWAFDAPKAWLGAKLLEDPSRDYQVLLKQWFEAAYGPAADAMRQAYQTMEDAWQRDAQRGGANQWIRHFREEHSAAVLVDGEIKAINRQLQSAKEALAMQDKLSHRLKNQRWRLDQFNEAWEMTLRFRRVYQARMAQPKTSTQAMAALVELSQAEATYKSSQDRFNLAWGASGQPLHWFEFIATNPRAEWVAKAAANPRLAAELQAWTKTDTAGKGALDYFISAAQAAGLEIAAHRIDALTLTGSPARPELLDISPGQNNAIEWQSEHLHVVAHGGKISRGDAAVSKGIPVIPGQVIRLTVNLDASVKVDPEAQVRLTLRFIGAKKTPTVSVLCAKNGGTVTSVVPPDATEADYEVVFEREIAIQGFDLYQFSAADLARR